MWLKRFLSIVTEPFQPAVDQAVGNSNHMELSAATLRQLNRLQLNASRYLPGASGGMRSSLRRKPAVTLHEHRMYVPGDDVRFVDWKASARHEHVFIRQGEQPKQATVYLLLDSSASMGWGDPPKSGAALRLAAAIAYMVLAHSDRLVFASFTDRLQHSLGPIQGKGQLPAFINHLKQIRFTGHTDVLSAIQNFRKSKAGNNGLVVVISDLLGCDDLAAVLGLLPAPGWDVNVLHFLHPEELTPTLTGDFELVDVENGRKNNYDITPKALSQYQANMRAWHTQLEQISIEKNSFYTVINSGWELDRETIPHLRSIRFLKPL